MTLQGIDPTQPIRTHQGRSALADAILRAPNLEQEGDALEWKSTYDLATTDSHLNIARHILAFANRRPEGAARTFSGCAYLVCGVEPGQVHGVAPVDSAQLAQGLERFVGKETGPRWRCDYVELDGKQVLVVAIDPPAEGDRIFPLMRTFGSFRAGTIFVRHGSKSESADPDDLDMLQERLLAGGMWLTLQVEWAESIAPVPAIRYSEADRREWIDQERGRLLDSLNRYQRPAGPAAMFISAGMLVPESRSPENYRSEVESYLTAAGELLAARLFMEGVRASKPVELIVRNETAETLEAVELILELGRELKVFLDEDDAKHRLGLADMPTAPRPYGPRPFERPSLFPPVGLFTSPHGAVPRPRPRISYGDITRLTFPTFDLRPYSDKVMDSFLLVGDEPVAGRTVQIQWSATATNAKGKPRGQLSAVVAAATFRIADIDAGRV